MCCKALPSAFHSSLICAMLFNVELMREQAVPFYLGESCWSRLSISLNQYETVVSTPGNMWWLGHMHALCSEEMCEAKTWS